MIDWLIDLQRSWTRRSIQLFDF